MLDELLILKKIKGGDIKAFEELFRRYYFPLCCYAAGITGQMEVAEEIVEELFYVLWKERERLQIFQSVKSYLYRATRNQSLQYCEHEEVRNRYRETVLTTSNPEQSTDPHQQMEYEELERQGFEPITLTAYISATLLSKIQIGNETVTIFNR